MTAEPSPRPWRVSESLSGTMSCILDANGEHIASCFGMPTEADAALIVAAVNLHKWIVAQNRLNAGKVVELIEERDRLRDLVRRLVGYCEAVTVYRLPTVEVRASDGTHADYNGEELLREARAALGEDR